MSRRFLFRLPWVIFAVVLGLGIAGQYLEIQNSRQRDADYYLLVVFIVFAVVGAFIASRVPSNPMGWLFLTSAGLPALGFFGVEYAVYAVRTDPGTLPAPQLVGWAATWTWIPALTLMGTFLFLLFPDGHLPSRRWRPAAWLAGAVLAVGTIGTAFSEGTLAGEGIRLENPVGFIPNPGGGDPVVEDVLLPVLLVAVALSMASLFFRYRAARGEQRQQLKWFLFAAALLVVSFATGELLPVAISNLLFALAVAALPAAAAVAVLKYRLYDIDVVINKTVVYLVLAAFITLVYVLVVVVVPVLVFGAEGGFNPLPFAAAAIVALAFQPVRRWATRLANRLVYGERASPYEVLSRFAERVAGSYTADEVLPSVARTLGQGTGAARTEVWLRVGSELRREAAWPDGGPGRRALPMAGGELPRIPGAARAFPVEHQGELLGALAISMPRGDTVTPTNEKLLRDVASQAGLVLRNVRLVEELRASRQRLVAAQDEERRRLERNIHDGAQQQLVALAVKLRLAETITRKDADKGAELVAEARGETQDALDNLRDLARGIYPPLLADQGLAAALEAQARKALVPVEVEPNGVGRYPQEAEAAAYFCVLEALQNVAKYAEASRVTVRLRAEDGTLVFAVEDDGRGFDVERTPTGSGLQNMSDRLEALGGRVEVRSSPGTGTTVTGRIPVGS